MKLLILNSSHFLMDCMMFTVRKTSIVLSNPKERQVKLELVPRPHSQRLVVQQVDYCEDLT